MTRVVVDASVAVKWYLNEEHGDKALRLLSSDFELIVPHLFFAEVGNVLWKQRRRGEIEDDLIADILAALDKVPCEVRADRLLLPMAMKLATGLDRTVYDSLYLAAAIGHRGAPGYRRPAVSCIGRRQPPRRAYSVDRGIVAPLSFRAPSARRIERNGRSTPSCRRRPRERLHLQTPRLDVEQALIERDIDAEAPRDGKLAAPAGRRLRLAGRRCRMGPGNRWPRP